MNEDNLNTLRQQDTNLRDAIRLEEMERPQMPADLNARLMQRVAQKPRKATVRRIWPWLVAACVAGVMIIWLTPPKTTKADVVAENTVIEQPINNNKVEETQVVNEETEAKVPIPNPIKVNKAKVKATVVKRDAALLAQETKAEQPAAKPTAEEVHKDLAIAETAKPQEKIVTLTERDIPITRPENYQYTPEELALMKKQANEAYLKWVELELEIAKHNLQQTAQQ